MIGIIIIKKKATKEQQEKFDTIIKKIHRGIVVTLIDKKNKKWEVTAFKSYNENSIGYGFYYINTATYSNKTKNTTSWTHKNKFIVK